MAQSGGISVVGHEDQAAVRAPAAAPALACRNLRHAFGDRVAVEDVSFEVAPGQAFGLLGPNGAGKTTTIKMICGLLEPDAGNIFIGGHAVVGNAIEAKRCLGYVPQEIALYPDLSALQNLEYWGRLVGLRGARLAERAHAVLEIVALADRAADRVADFSGGMQRRLNLAVALLGEPSVLVLDEPTVGVDAHSRGAIIDQLVRLRASGVALLYASHYMDEIEQLCDVVAIVDHGRVIAQGAPSELVASLGTKRPLTVRVTGNQDAFIAGMRETPGISDVTVADGAVRMLVDDPSVAITHVVQLAARVGAGFDDIDLGSVRLEEVFMQLTGRSLRD